MTREQYITYRNRNNILDIIWEYAKLHGIKGEKTTFLMNYINKVKHPAIKEMYEEFIIDFFDLKFVVTKLIHVERNIILKVL